MLSQQPGKDLIAWASFRTGYSRRGLTPTRPGSRRQRSSWTATWLKR